MAKEKTESENKTKAVGKSHNVDLRLLIGPRLSEKVTNLGKLGKYVFSVDSRANKFQIKTLLEAQYGIKIASVRTVQVLSKKKRTGRFSGTTSAYKKAIVSLKADSAKPEVA